MLHNYASGSEKVWLGSRIVFKGNNLYADSLLVACAILQLLHTCHYVIFDIYPSTCARHQDNSNLFKNRENTSVYE